MSIWKMKEEAAQVGAGLEREDQRKEERAESSKPGKFIPSTPAQRVGSGGKDSGKGDGGVRCCPAHWTEVIWGPAHPHQVTVEGRAEAQAELGECRAVRRGRIPLPPPTDPCPPGLCYPGGSTLPR